MRFSFIAALVGLGTANPILPGLEKRTTPKGGAFCSTVNSAVTALKQQAAATAYCSSFLSIPVSTTKTTVGGGGPATTTISSDSSTSTTTTVSTCLVPSAASKQKRSGASKPKPGCFSNYSTGPLITSACKCLSIPTSTTTLTVQGAGGGGPTVTVNQGTVTTSTSTVYARPAMASQQVYAYAPGNTAVNRHFLFGPYFGDQAQDIENGEQYGFSVSRSCCASFTILENGNLRANGNPGGILYQNAGNPRVRAKSASSFTDADVALVCSYEGRPDGTCPMTCTGVNGNQNNNDADLWRLNSQAGGWQLYALPANA